MEKLTMKVRELGNFIRDQRNSARISLRKLSTLTGVSNPYLSQIERGLRRPSADILQAIAKALRISAETLYVKAGILDERGPGDPVAEILHDSSINDRQKQILIELYQSFRDSSGSTATKQATVAKQRPAKATAKKPPAKARKAVAAARRTKPAAKPPTKTTVKAKKRKR